MKTIARYVNIDSGMMLTTEYEDGKLKGLIGKTIKVELCEFDTVQVNNQWYTIVGTYGALSQIELIDDAASMINHNCVTRRPMEVFEEQTGLALTAAGMETYNNIKSNPGISDQELAKLHSTHSLEQVCATIDLLQKYYLTASYWTEERI